MSCAAAAAAAKSLQSCPTLWDPIVGSPPGSPVPGILQARTLEWVAISLSNAWKWKVKVKLLSRIRLLATPWTASMGFSRQEYWSGVPLPSPSCLVHLGKSLKHLQIWFLNDVNSISILLLLQSHVSIKWDHVCQNSLLCYLETLLLVLSFAGSRRSIKMQLLDITTQVCFLEHSYSVLVIMFKSLNISESCFLVCKTGIIISTSGHPCEDETKWYKNSKAMANIYKNSLEVPVLSKGNTVKFLNISHTFFFFKGNKCLSFLQLIRDFWAHLTWIEDIWKLAVTLRILHRCELYLCFRNILINLIQIERFD